MKCGKAEDAGGLSPVKDYNAAARHFIRRTLTIFNRGDYIILFPHKNEPFCKCPLFKENQYNHGADFHFAITWSLCYNTDDNI